MFFKKNLTTAAICAALSVAAFSAMATDSTDTELTIIGEYTVHVPQLLRAAALLTMGNIITVR